MTPLHRLHLVIEGRLTADPRACGVTLCAAVPPGPIMTLPLASRDAPLAAARSSMMRSPCFYPDYERLLSAAPDHARRLFVFNYPRVFGDRLR
jgi:hypothetical protein